DQALPAIRLVLEQFGGLADGQSYADESDWLAAATFPDGTTKLDHQAFADVQDQTALRLSTAKGYLLRRVLRDKITVGEFLAWATQTFGFLWGKNGLGQLRPILLTQAASAAADGRLFRQWDISRW